MTTVDRLDPQIWLADSAIATPFPVYPISAKFGYDKTMHGTCSLDFPATDEAVELFMGASLGSEFPEVSCRVFARGGAVPVWGGVVTGATVSHKGGPFSGVVTVDLEHFWAYFHRLRFIAGAAAMTSADKTTNADNLALQVQRENIGGVAGAGLVTPTNYPTSTTARNDFGSFTPEVVADHSPALHGTSPRRVIQSGNNLAEFVDHFYEQYDLAPVLTDGLDNTFDIDNDYPFEDSDLTDTVIFGEYHGNLCDFKLDSDRTAMANTWMVEGNATSVRSWTESAASVTAWGHVEATAQKPQDAGLGTPSGDTLVEATWLAALYGPARVSYTAELLETTGHVFITDWFWRDKIALDIETYGLQIEATVNEWQMQIDDSGIYKIGVRLGTPRPTGLTDFLAGYSGRPGAYFAGNRFRNKRQA